MPAMLWRSTPTSKWRFSRLGSCRTEVRLHKATTQLDVRRMDSGESISLRYATVLPGDVFAVGPGPVVAFTTEWVATRSVRSLNLWWPVTDRLVTYDRLDRMTPAGGARIEATNVARPTFSPSGERLALIGAREEAGQDHPVLVILDVKTGDARQITLPRSILEGSGSGLRDLRWDPSGKQIYVSGLLPDPAANSAGQKGSEFGIFLLDVATAKWQDLGKAPRGFIGIDDRAEFLIADGQEDDALAVPKTLNIQEYFAGGSQVFECRNTRSPGPERAYGTRVADSPSFSRKDQDLRPDVAPGGELTFDGLHPILQVRMTRRLGSVSLGLRAETSDSKPDLTLLLGNKPVAHGREGYCRGGVSGDALGSPAVQVQRVTKIAAGTGSVRMEFLSRT